MTIKRRDFLGRMAAGSAVLSMPAFLAGCGVQSATTVGEPAPDNPFAAWFNVDQASMARVMSELTTRGADTAELYFQHARSNSLTFEDGAVSKADTSIEHGVGLRVVIGEQTGYAYTEDLGMPSMLGAARKASKIAAAGPAGSPQAFKPSPGGDLYTISVPWSDVDIDRKLPMFEFVEQQARSMDPAIDRVAVYWADADERVMIATLDGNLVTDHRPMTRMTVVVTATRNGKVQTGHSNIAGRQELAWYSEERLAATAREAVDRTMIQFEARRAPEGEMPVILAAGASGVLLHEAIGHGLEADYNRNGTSAYSGRTGERVAKPSVSIVHQATIPGERGALNYDDEGNRTGRTVLVENGILRSYLHDTISARQYGLAPTGSGRRESYRFAPMPRMTCTFMENGPHTKDEIIAAVDRGIVCETYTDGKVQIGAGDFTFSVKNGWLVEKGRITAPIKDVNIVGNGPDLLQRISMVADDARLDKGGWTCGKNGQRVPVSQGVPTLLVPGMAVTAATPR